MSAVARLPDPSQQLLVHLAGTHFGEEPIDKVVPKLLQDFHGLREKENDSTKLQAMVLGILRGCARIEDAQYKVTDFRKFKDMTDLAEIFCQTTPSEIRDAIRYCATRKIASGVGIQGEKIRQDRTLQQENLSPEEQLSRRADRVRGLFPQLVSRVSHDKYHFWITGTGMRRVPIRPGQFILSLCSLDKIDEFSNRMDDKQNITHLVVPMGESDLVKTVKDMQGAKDSVLAFARAVRENREAYVHCQAGCNRSATVASMLIMAMNHAQGNKITWDQAFAIIQQHRPNAALSVAYHLMGHAMEQGEEGWKEYCAQLLTKGLDITGRQNLTQSLAQIRPEEINGLQQLFLQLVEVFRP